MKKEKTTLEIVVESSGIPVSLLAEKVGVSRRAIWNYMTGDSLPRVDVALKIAEVLHTSVDALWL